MQTVTSCPDAPFVVCLGGDNPSQNFLVTDIRESAQVRLVHSEGYSPYLQQNLLFFSRPWKGLALDSW
jgi:hypothetical protein